MNIPRDYLRAFAIGAVTGLRSMSGPAAVELRSHSALAAIVPIMALGEMIVDKLPGIPSRTGAPQLAVRAVAGGFAGWQIAGPKSDRRIGLALGVAGALAASFLGERLRARAGAITHLPDAVVALVEDGAAIVAGLALTAPSTPSTDLCAK